MNPMNVMQYVSSAAITGDDNKAGLFIGIMVVMALIIVGLVVFSIISSKKNADNEGEAKGPEKKDTDQK